MVRLLNPLYSIISVTLVHQDLGVPRRNLGYDRRE
jgi:hypothetical protein